MVPTPTAWSVPAQRGAPRPRGQRPLPLLLPFLAIAVLAAGCGRTPKLSLESDPVGASVWVNDELRGPTPQSLELREGASLRVRVVLPGYRDWETTVSAAAAAPGGRLVAKLVLVEVHSLHCTSHPPGAEVLVDGEVRGTTPVTIEGIESGACEVVLRAEGWKTERREVRFSGEDDPVVVDVALESLSESYYLSEIRDAPHELANYVDLAHHYVLQKEFLEAVGILEKGIDRVLKHGAAEGEGRLWSEINRITVMQFAYGTEEDLYKARLAVRDMLRGVLKRYPYGNPGLFGEYVYVLSALGERGEGRRRMDEALRRFPSSKELQRLRKQLTRELYGG